MVKQFFLIFLDIAESESLCNEELQIEVYYLLCKELFFAKYLSIKGVSCVLL